MQNNFFCFHKQGSSVVDGSSLCESHKRLSIRLAARWMGAGQLVALVPFLKRWPAVWGDTFWASFTSCWTSKKNDFIFWLFAPRHAGVSQRLPSHCLAELEMTCTFWIKSSFSQWIFSEYKTWKKVDLPIKGSSRTAQLQSVSSDHRMWILSGSRSSQTLGEKVGQTVCCIYMVPALKPVSPFQKLWKKKHYFKIYSWIHSPYSTSSCIPGQTQTFWDGCQWIKITINFYIYLLKKKSAPCAHLIYWFTGLWLFKHPSTKHSR